VRSWCNFMSCCLAQATGCGAEWCKRFINPVLRSSFFFSSLTKDLSVRDLPLPLLLPPLNQTYAHPSTHVFMLLAFSLFSSQIHARTGQREPTTNPCPTMPFPFVSRLDLLKAVGPGYAIQPRGKLSRYTDIRLETEPGQQ